MPQSNKKRSEFRTTLDVELAKAGLSQTALAQKLGVAPTSLSGWLCGSHPAPDDLVERIEKALKLSAGCLTAEMMGGAR
jgi:transcriptional regulator with XRE-family HTH domain